jgi:hypothetical protein
LNSRAKASCSAAVYRIGLAGVTDLNGKFRE